MKKKYRPPKVAFIEIQFGSEKICGLKSNWGLKNCGSKKFGPEIFLTKYGHRIVIIFKGRYDLSFALTLSRTGEGGQFDPHFFSMSITA